MFKKQNQDALKKYCNQEMLHCAKQVLTKDDQTEEEFLGAQGILILNGLI